MSPGAGGGSWPFGQVAAAERDFRDTYQADVSGGCKHRIVVDLDKKNAAEYLEQIRWELYCIGTYYID